MSSSKKSMDMCEGDSEKCEGKLKEKIAFNYQKQSFFYIPIWDYFKI